MTIRIDSTTDSLIAKDVVDLHLKLFDLVVKLVLP